MTATTPPTATSTAITTPTPTPTPTPTDGARDFDFLIGHWQVSNRRLSKHFQGSQEWETFQATQQARLLPGGIGNYDDFLPVGWRPGFVGMSLRVFNPQTQRFEQSRAFPAGLTFMESYGISVVEKYSENEVPWLFRNMRGA